MSASEEVTEYRSAVRRQLRRIVALRVELVIVTLLLASLVLFLVDYFGAERSWEWSRNIPFRELAATALSTGIIGVIWEWFIRADASEQLRRALVEIGDQQRPVLAHAVASAVVTDDRLLNSLISTDNADRVLRAALVSASGSEELADGLRHGLVDGVLAGEDYWENYRARVYVTDSTDLFGEGADLDTFFDFTVEIRYETTLRKSVFRFGAASSPAVVGEMTADRAFDGCWLVAPSRPYSELDARLFDLRYMRVAGVDLDVSGRSDQGRIVYTAESAGLGASIGERVSVEYRYTMKFDKRGHIFTMNTRVPTRRAEYELDYSQSSITHVNIFAFLLASVAPKLRTGKDTARPGIVQVDTDGWTFPPGGVAFGWVLKAEHDPAFLHRIGGAPEDP